MRNSIKVIVGALLIISAPLLQAQTSVYLVSGVHSSGVTASGLSTDIVNLKAINRFTGGIMLDHSLDKYLSVSSGVFYSQRGFQVAESFGFDIANIPVPLGVKVATEVNTIDVPLMLKYKIQGIDGVTPYVAAGPGLTYAISGSIRTKATAILDFTLTNTPLNLESDDFNRLGIDANVAAGLTFPYGKGEFLTEVSYSRAMTDFTSEDFIIDAGLRTKGISLTVGYGIRF
jgi:hypothetical protein